MTEILYKWCTSIDTRDWAGMRSILTEPVKIDYSSNGSIAGDLAVDTWIDRLKGLHGFDRTLHMVSNPVVTVNGDAATCVSYVNAMHFLKDGDRELGAYACGIYTHELVRVNGSWKIRAATFDLAGRHSGSAAFDEAFVRARALAPSRMPA
ncbi:MAG: nuclear transport factor 2 family protein [Alphaproteobacteria bacterium]|nr:nuclear transport factor 2 family protein [Alphaproteobacteria bacterium]